MVIALIANKNWYKYLIIDIYSLLINNKVKKIYLFVESNKVSDIPYLGKIKKRFSDVEFVLIDANKVIDKYFGNLGNYQETRFTSYCLLKLLFTEYIKEDKVLYVDTDAIVKKNIEDLWNQNLSSYYLAGVQDIGIFNRGYILIDHIKENYINSGVVLFNLKKMREDNIQDRLIDVLINNNLLYPDQDALNLVCHDNILFLPSIYNFSYEATNTDDITDVRIFHYAGYKFNWVYDKMFGNEFIKAENSFYNELGDKEIDIIIPAYNAHNTLEKSLISIKNQTIKDKISVYIIDDASDNSYHYLVDKYNMELDITLITLDQNRGPGYARQFGLDISHSKYVMFIDSDDVFYDEYSVENIYKSIDESGLDAVSGKMIEDRYGKFNEYYTGFDTLHAIIYRKSFIESKNIRFPELYNSEDIAFNNLVILNTDKIGSCDAIVYVYVRRNSSLTQTEDYNDKHIRCYCDSFNYVINKAIIDNIDKTKIANLLRSTFSYFYYYYNYENLNDSNSKINIYKFIPYYNHFMRYHNLGIGSYWLNFWTIRVNELFNNEGYNDFIDKCNNFQ